MYRFNWLKYYISNENLRMWNEEYGVYSADIVKA